MCYMSFMTNIANELGGYRKRLESMHGSYNSAVREKEIGEIEELSILRAEIANDCKYLDTVIFSQLTCTESTLTKIRIRNAVSIRDIEYCGEDEILMMNQRVDDQKENLWRQLDDVILEYELLSGSKGKQHKRLNEQDGAMRVDAAQFPKLHSKLQYNVEILRDNYRELMNKRCRRINELKAQIKESNGSIWNLRQEIRIKQVTHAIQLKHTNIMSVRVIKKLTRIEEKGSALLQLIRMCSRLEPTILAVKKYVIYCAEIAEEANASCVISPYDKMDKFWEHYNYVKAENIQKKYEQYHLILENKRMRHTLRNYLVTLSNKHAIRPQSSR